APRLLVRPRPRAADVRRPEKIAAAPLRRCDRIGPRGEDDGTVRLAHTAPARAAVLQPYAPRLERPGASDQTARLGARRGPAAHTRIDSGRRGVLQRLAAKCRH